MSINTNETNQVRTTKVRTLSGTMYLIDHMPFEGSVLVSRVSEEPIANHPDPINMAESDDYALPVEGRPWRFRLADLGWFTTSPVASVEYR